MNEENKKIASKINRGICDKDLNKLLDILKTVEYGSVTLVIQDGVLVQIDKNEKMRLK